MVEQVQNWEKNVSPIDENRILGRKVQSRTLFFPWGNFPFLDLRSEGLSSLAALGRQLSFFSTIAESEKFPRGKKSSSSFVFLPRKLLSIKEEYIFLSFFESYQKMRGKGFPLIFWNVENCKISS